MMIPSKYAQEGALVLPPEHENVLTYIRDFDYTTYEHSMRVAEISKHIGNIIGITDIRLTISAALHDIGKLHIPKSILNKDSKLSDKEFDIIKLHPALGCIIAESHNIKDDSILRGIYEHHERYCGGGYPNSIDSDDIHIYARIIAIADVYDALTSKRCYKDKLTQTSTIQYMISDKGHFDQYILHTFLKSIR